MNDLIQIGESLLTKDMQSTHLTKDDIHSYKGIKLNHPCIVSDESRKLYEMPNNMLGKFISDEGKWLIFKSKTGYKECICKWELVFGSYKVRYL